MLNRETGLGTREIPDQLLERIICQKYVDIFRNTLPYFLLYFLGMRVTYYHQAWGDFLLSPLLYAVSTLTCILILFLLPLRPLPMIQKIYRGFTSNTNFPILFIAFFKIRRIKAHFVIINILKVRVNLTDIGCEKTTALNGHHERSARDDIVCVEHNGRKVDFPMHFEILGEVGSENKKKVQH